MGTFIIAAVVLSAIALAFAVPRPLRSHRRLAAAVGLLLPVAAVGLYLVFGGGRAAFDSGTTVAPSPATEHAQGPSGLSVEDATKRLAERLEREPNDAAGWALLASSYRYLGKTAEAEVAAARAAELGMTVEPAAEAAPAQSEGPGVGAPAIADLERRVAAKTDDADALVALGRAYQAQQRFADAAQTFGQAIQLRPGDPNLLADRADALAAANGRHLAGEPQQLIDQALAIDPNHHKALWLAATAAQQAAEDQQALKHWEHLLSVLPPESPDRRIISANIEETRGRLSPGSTVAATLAGAARVAGTVRISPELAGELAADDTVFIFARAASGPRMPVAVLRKRGADLPAEFVLDDTLAVMPAAKLSMYPEVVIGARVSRSGSATPQRGDLEGLSGTVKVGDGGTVEVVIDRRNGGSS
jgi:cytochrome c-type biogenesis protein CcmH